METMIILCIAAFAAGFVDAIVGGGGLIQTPATLIVLPQYSVATLLGTTKIPSFTGTFMAAIQYAGRVALQKKLLALMCTLSLIAAYAGSKLVAHVSNAFMKPFLLIVLIFVALYTYSKKDFGNNIAIEKNKKKELPLAAVFALLIGFYDGFIGPGAGSFLILFFISLLGFDFLKASAHAKFVNLATNMGSILFFSGHSNIMYQYAIPMAVLNLAGSLAGSRLAILKGNAFIRVFFLAVVGATILRFGYDIFFR